MKLTDIKGVGPKKAEKLNQMGIFTPTDLMHYLPRKYEDRSRFATLDQAQEDIKNFFILKVENSPKTYFFKKNMSITRSVASDRTGKVNLVWFNDRFTAQKLEIGKEYKFFGKYDKEKNQLNNPLLSQIEDDFIGGIYPTYSVLKGFSKKDFIKIKNQVFESKVRVNDFLPDKLLMDKDLLDINTILKVFHNPKDYTSLFKAKRDYAIRNALLEVISRSKSSLDQTGYMENKAISLSNYIKSLSFQLTEDQQKALSEISEDMIVKKQMNRIVIGDVGSGKTITAILAAITSMKNQKQVAFMAPTELLAIQHYKNYESFLDKHGFKAAILTGSTPTVERNNIYENLKQGKIDIIFGTHALFQDKIKYKDLGLVIMDEQQRFGVYQRKLLAEKGQFPDILLLSATPIPRTLALTKFKDLDVSIIKSRPAERKPIETYLVDQTYEKRFIKFIYKNITAGRQAYVVCPRVEEDDEIEVNSVEGIYKKYKKIFASKAKVDFIHGKLSPEEKEKKQEDFADGKVDILIATTIIEVGIDVKNANIMVIYDANYFGMSQLHQIRGRIGRGQHQSYCILVKSNSEEDDEKLTFIESNNDGFEIANKDLELRGGGDRFGLFQSGLIEDSGEFLYDEDIYEEANTIFREIESGLYKLDNKLIEQEIIKTSKIYDKVIMN